FAACLDAFLDGDFPACIEQARGLIRSAPPVVFHHLFISAERCGEARLLADLGPRVLALLEEGCWDHTLLCLTLGRAEPGAVLAAAADDEQRCQAHYYHGCRLLTHGDETGMRTAFAACLASTGDYLEKELAACLLDPSRPRPF